MDVVASSLNYNCIEIIQMLLTKMLLTEILLDVTNEEIYHVAKDVHRKAIKGMLILSSFVNCFILHGLEHLKYIVSIHKVSISVRERKCNDSVLVITFCCPVQCTVLCSSL